MGADFIEAIYNYKVGDVVYISYTVTISHTDSSSKKIDMTYTYEDVAPVYIID